MVSASGGTSLLPDLARRHAAGRPDAPAILDVATGRVLTWSDLDRSAEAIADEARTQGLRPGDRVGLAVSGSLLGVVALHGLPRAGVSSLLVHPRLTPVEVEALLAGAACSTLVIDPATGIVAPRGVATIRLQAADTTPAAEPGPRTDSSSPSLPELIVPTAATTGASRLARLPLDRIAASAAAWNAFLPPPSGWLLSLGLAHVAGIGVVSRAAATGSPIAIPADLSARGLLEAIESARELGIVASHLSLVATQLAAILDIAGQDVDGVASGGGTRDRRFRAPDGLAAVILGGGPLPEPLLRRALAAGWPVIPSYGMTETASGVVAMPTAEVAAHPGSAGRPLPGVEVRIDEGRIAVRGPMVFAGYLAQGSAATRPTGDGWLQTGDLGTIDADGRLTVIGRSDDVIVSGGEKVVPAEVEGALRELPDVRDVVVVGVPDATWGQTPVAVVVLESGSDPTDDDLRAHAWARLARHKVPTRFVRVPELPRNAMGKVVRADVMALVRESGAAGQPAALGPRHRTIIVDDGQPVAIRELAAASADPDGVTVVLLHATLSASGQLVALARQLAARARVVLVDRRGSGDSPMANPEPVPVARHVADVVDVLDDLRAERVVIVGHSFGGVVALEAAARHPDRIASVIAWEPPYLAVAAEPVRAAMSSVAADVAGAFARGGSTAAARSFLDAVAGAGAWDRLHPRQRRAIGREGTGALADAAMEGLEPDGLGRIICPVTLATGDASEPFYAPIADALAARVGPRAERIHLPGLRHPAPITDPSAIAGLILSRLDGTTSLETHP